MITSIESFQNSKVTKSTYNTLLEISQKILEKNDPEKFAKRGKVDHSIEERQLFKLFNAVSLSLKSPASMRMPMSKLIEIAKNYPAKI